jgi:hypothetical protein
MTMADFAAVLELSDLDGTNGFRINGEAARDYAGFSVASAGDINGDGLTDLIISANSADTTGAAYVVFGRIGGFASELDLADLDGTDGFKISGDVLGDSLGSSVAAAGDFDGDGYADLMIGAFGVDQNGVNAGAVYVMFGRDGGFAAETQASSLTGSSGFQIHGEKANDSIGADIASAGDINGDGYADLVIGNDSLGDNGERSGGAYVVFGSAAPFPLDFDLASLDGTNGFKVLGETDFDFMGRSVASAGDINGDGYDDLLVGADTADSAAGQTGAAYVIFGKAGGFASEIDASSLNGANGFKLAGAAASESSGYAVSSAGDVNGDGLADLLVGAPYGQANGNVSGVTYVVFGKTGGFTATLDLATLDGASGFRLTGENVGDASGLSVAAGGDINGDGYGDLIIGAYKSRLHGYNTGASYVVFGKAGGFAASIALGSLDGTNGFRIYGEAGSDKFGRSVSSAGDINGDGVDDLVVGAPYADGGSFRSGVGYIIFGRQTDLTLTGDGAANALNGRGANDHISGLAGKDVLSGLAGDDIIDGGADNDVLSGGLGADDLVGGTGNDILGGDDGDDALNGGDGSDKLNGGAGIDHLTGGTGADQLSGGDGVDTLDGGADNDLLDGGTGADAMTGGTGNDVFLVDNAGDQTIEAAGEGYDIVRTARNGWILGADIEGLELQGSGAIDGSGNALANNIQGNDGNNTLSGLAGVDTLNGGAGDDRIIGGVGGDLLRGGADADTFVILQESVGNAVLETDTVYDYAAGDNDRIDLSAIDANSIQDGNQAFTFAEFGFTKTAGQMTLTFASGQTTLRLDVNGDGKADYQMKINGDVTHESAGWAL